jgi:hypothetical protein
MVAGPAPGIPMKWDIILKLNGAFDAEVGDIVTLSDGITTRELLLSNLTVTSINTNTDSVSGTATPFSRVEVDFFPEGYHPTVDADVSGNWLADFSTRVTRKMNKILLIFHWAKTVLQWRQMRLVSARDMNILRPIRVFIVTHNEIMWKHLTFLMHPVTLAIDDPSYGVGGDYQASKQMGVYSDGIPGLYSI